MIEAVRALTAEYDMLPRGGAVLCAVSGGADSMCLLHLLSSLAKEGGFRVSAAHYNHSLRGAESDRDAAFVAEWCALRGIPCIVGAGDVGREAELRGLGVEETARQMRYEFLRTVADTTGCDRIATAHSADDNLETLLLHLVRGAGLHGLAGIPPRRGDIVRPLLTTARADIMAYLEEHHVPHVEDSTNTDEAYARNRIRRQVVPVLRQLNPRLTESAAETMGYLRADDDFLNAQAAAACRNARWAEDDLVIEARYIAQLPAAIAPRAVRRLLEMMGDGGAVNCSAAHLKAVVGLARGDDPSAVVHLPGGRLASGCTRSCCSPPSRPPCPPSCPPPWRWTGRRRWRARPGGCAAARCAAPTGATGSPGPSTWPGRPWRRRWCSGPGRRGTRSPCPGGGEPRA